MHSDFIAGHRLMSVDASLSQQLCTLGIFAHEMRVVAHKTSLADVGRCKQWKSECSIIRSGSQLSFLVSHGGSKRV